MLRAVEQDHDACLERDLQRVAVDDPSYRHLHDLLSVRSERRRG